MEEKKGFGCGLYGGAACWLADTTPRQSIVYEYFYPPLPLGPQPVERDRDLFHKAAALPAQGVHGAEEVSARDGGEVGEECAVGVYTCVGLNWVGQRCVY